MGGGAVFVPRGRYLLRQRLELPAGVVLRGADRDATVLFFPEPLSARYGDLDWRFSGGFVSAWGSAKLPHLAQITSASSRGARTLSLSDASQVQAGDWVVVAQTDDAGTLIRRLHADLMAGGIDNEGALAMRFPSRVLSVNGSTVELERALPVDVELRWAPAVYALEAGRPGAEALGQADSI